MTHDHRSAASRESRSNDYESTVLEFLDKELAAASTSTESRGSQRDDVEQLVDTLLQEAIAASGVPESTDESESEELHRLLSSALAGRAGDQPPEQNVSQPEVQEGSSEPAIYMPDSSAVTPAVPAPVFAAASRCQPGRGRLMILFGAFACLLAATGIVFFSGSLRFMPDESGALSADAGLSGGDLPALPARSAEDTEFAAPVAAVSADPGNPDAAEALKNRDARAVPARSAAKSPPLPEPGTNRPTAAAPPPANSRLDGPGEKPASIPWNAAENSEASLPVRTSAESGLFQAPPAQPLAGTLKDLIPNPATGPVPPPQETYQAVPAEAVSQITPEYPELARKSRVTGTVIVEAVVDEQGRVVRATAVSGPYLLRAAAVNAVLRWRFRPATINGTSIISTSNVSIVFK